MVTYPNADFAERAGIVRNPRPYRSTRCQLEELGYRYLGCSNGWDTKLHRWEYQYRAGNKDWTEVLASTSGMSITVSITGKAFYDTDSSD